MRLQRLLGQTIHYRPLVVAVWRNALPPGWANEPVYYWTRYENVFGEPFETRNSSDPREPAEFRRVEGAD